MKRLGLLAIVVVLVGAGILVGIRRGAVTPHAAVASLLPKETVALIHVPDFNRMRAEWRKTDIYKLYQEPAVQDFLGKPLAQIPNRDTTAATIRDMEQLGIRDGFVALTSIDNDNPILVAGFRFRGSQSNADKIISRWRNQITVDGAPRNTVEYQQYKIDVAGAGRYEFATVYDRDWFFATNNLDQLKMLLDRADGRLKESLLQQDENFRATMAHMPASYAAGFYLEPKTFTDKLAALRAQAGSNEQQTTLEQIHGICGALRFDGGKLRDTFFAAMPKLEQGPNLTRSAAALGTSDTVLYLASLLNAEKLSHLNHSGSILPFGDWMQKVFDVASRKGLTVSDWKAAFKLELGILAEWSQNAHWPWGIITLPVKDPNRARKLVDTLTIAIDEDGSWTKTNKEGVDYFALQIPGKLLAVTPTIALSDQLFVGGVDLASVESAINRSRTASGGLERSKTYKSAIRGLPEPTNFFAYVDLPVLYERLDSSLRPMLLMAAMFMPAMSRNVDWSKLPSPEIVTKHLSPIVSAQRYDGDGYTIESVGPITLSQLVLGVAIPATFWWKNNSLRN